MNDLICVRIGGNDLMDLLGIRHPEEHTIYDTPLRTIIDDILLALRPQGIEVSAPVFDFIDRPWLLSNEVALDRARGFLTKTAIHPCQVAVIENGLQVCDEQRAVARRILDKKAAAVFQMSGGMCEPMTHRAWAQRIALTGAAR